MKIKFQSIKHCLNSAYFASGCTLQQEIAEKMHIPINLTNYKGEFNTHFVLLTQSVTEQMKEILVKEPNAKFLGISGALNVYLNEESRQAIDILDCSIVFPQKRDTKTVWLGRGPSYKGHPQPWYLSTGSWEPIINGTQHLCYFTPISI